jgi:hypothetical protein
MIRFQLNQFVFLFFFAVSGKFALAQTSELAPKEANAIRAEIFNLTGSERETNRALERLQQFPRAKVLAVLRDELKSTPTVAASVLRGVVAIQARELFSELKTLVEKNDGWQGFARVHQVFAEEADMKVRGPLTEIFVARLPQVPAPSQVAILEALRGWKYALSATQYRELLESASFDVRLTAFSQFSDVRSGLPMAVQQDIIKLAVNSEIDELRLQGYKVLLILPEREKKSLAKSFGTSRCPAEENGKIKELCLKAGRGGL